MLPSSSPFLNYFRLKLFVGSHPVVYSGQRDLESLKNFVQQHVEETEVGVAKTP